MIAYSDHSGESVAEAVVITGAETTLDGIDAEKAWIAERHGPWKVDWVLKEQALLQEGGRSYDRMEITLTDGTEKTFYFDITDFFGKPLS